MKRLPIQAAKDVAERYNQQQVILVAWDAADGLTHVVSYGTTLAACEQAAAGANVVKRALGFPEELCNTKPSRVRRRDRPTLPNGPKEGDRG